MAKIIGESGSLVVLKNRFQLSGIWSFNTFTQFETLKNNPNKLSRKIRGIGKENIEFAQKVLRKYESFYWGAVGECYTIDELSKLPESYLVLNEVKISFTKSIYWKKHGEYIKSCKVDQIVIGPTGIFLIETKNLSEERLRNTTFSPHKQIDRAGHIFFIHMMNQFERKLPVFKIVATKEELEYSHYEFIYQLPIHKLNKFILTRVGCLSKDEVEDVSKWLLSGPMIFNDKKSDSIRTFFSNMIKGI